VLKLIILGIVGYFIYKIYFNKKVENNSTFQNNSSQQNDSDELVECSNCHTFVPKSECKFINNECLCKDCQ
jgi:formylmethanofuran dehydrogenase subunit E